MFDLIWVATKSRLGAKISVYFFLIILSCGILLHSDTSFSDQGDQINPFLPSPEQAAANRSLLTTMFVLVAILALLVFILVLIKDGISLSGLVAFLVIFVIVIQLVIFLSLPSSNL